LTALCLLAAVPATAAAAPAEAPTGPAAAQTATPSPTPVPDPNLPTAEDGAKGRLESSPRHGEWVDIPFGEKGPALRSWVVYPERKDKAPVVIVIHEIYGLTDWIRSVADRLAAEGFIAVAPDFISGLAPGGGGTEATKSRDEVTGLVRGLQPADANARIDAVRAWTLKIPSSSGKLATLGFCWGGARSFAYATQQPDLHAAVVFYGSAPEIPALAAVKAPVLGLYGGDDARVNATIEATSAEMKKLGKTYEIEIYEGAGHGFLKNQAGRDGANLKATEKAWPRAVAFLKERLK
jgi:carboxymethylenebutenolidase